MRIAAVLEATHLTRAFDLGLPNDPGEIIIRPRELQCDRGRRRPSQFRDDALESYPYLGRSRRRRSEVEAGPGRALPPVLAADFFFRLSPRPFARGCTGSHPGFFSYDAGR